MGTSDSTPRFKTKILPPIKESSEDFEALERAIIELFKSRVYAPLIRELGYVKERLENGYTTEIIEALRIGRITYSAGKFSGQFRAGISRELKELGAKFDRKKSTWNITKDQLPIEVKNAISSSAYVFEKKLEAIDKKLAQIVPEEFAEHLKASKFFDSSLWKVDKELRASLDGIMVAPQLSNKARARIAAEWEGNMKLWITDFSKTEIKKLRAEMKTSVFAGNRYESAIGKIQKSYGVSQSKAKFLARQETNLLMSKFKETRYSEAGVKEYIWGCSAGSGKHPVRRWHKDLEGKTFKWDDPPITTKPGEPVRRNNPGEDFNCRCFAKPIVRFKKES